MSSPLGNLVEVSSDADTAELRAHLDRDGYLLVRQILPPTTLIPAHLAFGRAVREAGWTVADGSDDKPPEGKPDRACASPEPEYVRTYHELYREEVVHELADAPVLNEFAQRIFGCTVLRHPRIVGRLNFPGQVESATPPHQDHLQVQGTPHTITFWIPLHDCGIGEGLLAISPGSHKLGLLEVEPASGASGAAVVGADRLPWATSPMRRGDLLVFRSLTVHRSLPNLSSRFRFSIDCRFQPISESVSERSLDFPMTSDLTWDTITAGWSQPDLVVGWRKLDLSVVAYDDSVNTERDRAAIERARAGDISSASALQRIVAHDPDPRKVAIARDLLHTLNAPVPHRHKL